MTTVGGHRAQLDGLRAFAILGVLYTHFWEGESIWGHAGVRLFFVLSGYLITLQLLEGRDRRERGEASLLRHFYVRRALRLWPAYYVLLLLATAANILDMRRHVWWFALYLTNFFYARQDDWTPWVADAWWSLAVEEQFYLLWPAVVMAVSRRALPWVALAAFIIAIVTRANLSPGHLAFFLVTPSSFDALAGGALLAMAQHRGIVPGWFGWVAPPVWCASLALSALLPWDMAIHFSEPLTVLAYAALVALAVKGPRGPVDWLLANPAMRYLGRISYGVYLYHSFVILLLLKLAPHVPGLTARGPAAFLFGTLLTIAVATGSWYLLERPMNRLKRHFPYP